MTRSAAPVTIPAALVPQESPPVQTTNAPKSPSVAVAAPTIAGTAATPRTQTILAAQPGPVPVAAKPTTQAAPPALPDTSVIAAAPASASMETVPAPSGKTAAKIETTLPSANVAQATPVKQPSAPAVAETNAAAQIQNSKFKIENPTSPLPSPFAIGTDGSPVIVTPTLAANADPTVSLVANPLTPAVASVVESSVAVIRQSAAPELRNGIGSSLPVNETAKTAGTVASAGQQTAANSGGNESRNNNNANSNGGQRETARIAAVSGTANAGKTETASPVFSLGTGAGTNVSEIGDVSEIRNAKSGSQNLDRIQLVAQVTKHLEALRVRDGKSEMAINLRPDHLGSLRVTIATHADGVTARIVAEHHSVQQALESAKQDLRAALESKGLRLTQLDVTTNGSAGDGRTAFGNGSENGSRQPGLVPRPLRTSRNAESPEAAPIALVASRTGSTTLLDRVA